MATSSLIHLDVQGRSMRVAEKGRGGEERYDEGGGDSLSKKDDSLTVYTKHILEQTVMVQERKPESNVQRNV